MSTTYHAAAVVGCKIDRSKIFSTETVRGCEHSVTLIGSAALTSNKFCSHCGEKAWKEECRSIPEYDEDEGTICGFRVFDNEYDDYVIVGVAYTEVDSCDSHQIAMLGISPAANSSRERVLRAALEPIDLWDEEKFGIWPVMWTS